MIKNFNRSWKKVGIFSNDNLPGISQAIATAFPSVKIQKCMVHQIRNNMRFVSYKHKKEFVKDMKKIYKASNVKNAKITLKQFKEKWSQDYPSAVRSWIKNFNELVTFFDSPPSN